MACSCWLRPAPAFSAHLLPCRCRPRTAMCAAAPVAPLLPAGSSSQSRSGYCLPLLLLAVGSLTFSTSTAMPLGQRRCLFLPLPPAAAGLAAPASLPAPACCRRLPHFQHLHCHAAVRHGCQPEALLVAQPVTGALNLDSLGGAVSGPPQQQVGQATWRHNRGSSSSSSSTSRKSSSSLNDEAEQPSKQQQRLAL